MSASTEPVSPEHVEGPIEEAAQVQSALELQADGPPDVYAETELELRRERTERMIRRAQEQV